MSDERSSTVLSRARLPDQTTVVKRQTSSGQIQYVRRGPGINGELFISPDVGEGLEQTTELGGSNVLPDGESLSQSELDEFGLEVDRERVRERRIKNKYSEWDNFESIDDRDIKGGDSKSALRRRRIQSFLRNEVIEQQVKNDPLLESDDEERIAKESLAKQLVDELTKANSEREEKAILREYGFDY